VNLVWKFNAALLAIFILGFALASFVSYRVLQANAREEVLQHARIMIEAASSSRAYTNDQIKPLLETQLKYRFLPQSVPAFAATEQFNDMRKKYPDYSYKEATLNPTNPRYRASDWEADIVNQFRNAADKPEVIGERDTPSGRSFYIARPMQIKNEACLACHSTVDAAPKTLVDRYGPANGFGWKLNEVIGAQIVSVPTDVPIARANRAFQTFMLSLTAVFVFIFVVLNLMLWYMVIRPVTRLSRLADQVSQGENMDAPDFEVKSGDEIGILTQSFNRMKKSLVQAMKMLEA
jgi:HAMP domain-containing protein